LVNTFKEAEMSEESEDDSTPAAQLAKKTPEKHVKTKKLDQVTHFSKIMNGQKKPVNVKKCVSKCQLVLSVI
jgi:hypothetical protein